MIESEGLTHIHLRVADFERSLRFYQQVFGMREKFRDGDLVFLNTPGSQDTITLNPHDEGLAGQSGGIEHFGFRLKPGVSHDEGLQPLRQRGAACYDAANMHPGCRSRTSPTRMAM